MKSSQRYSCFWFDLLIFGALTHLVLAKGINYKGTGTTEATLNVGEIGEYEDSEDEGAAADEIKARPKSTIMPYFEEKRKTVYVKPGEKIVLDCPVKNYNESEHHILWFKEEKPITNGQQPLANAYKVDSNFTLIIEQYSDNTPGNYYCNVMPQNVRMHMLLTTDKEIKSNNQNMLTTSTTAIALLSVARILVTTVQLSSFMKPQFY